MEFSKLIPQIFFDVIARMIPGSVLLVGWALASGEMLTQVLLIPFGRRNGLEDSALFFVFVLLGFSYVLGHLLGPLSQFLEAVIHRTYLRKGGVLTKLLRGEDGLYPASFREFFSRAAASHYPRSTKAADQEAGAKTADEPWFPWTLSKQENRPSGTPEPSLEPKDRPRKHHTSFLYVWLDWLRWKEPDVGARIVKIRAEVKLQSQLAAAGGVIGLFQISAGGWSWASMGWVSLVLLGLVNYCRLYRIFELSILNHCAALEIGQGILDPNRTHARV